MTKEAKVVYTIQNEHGDEGFIQKFKDGCEIDEIIGWNNNRGALDKEFLYMYCVITKTEYDAIKALHEAFDENNYSELFDANQMLIQYVLEKNRHRILTMEDIHETEAV